MKVLVTARRTPKVGKSGLGALALALALTGCGSESSRPGATAVTGVVTIDASPSGTVSLKDSSAPAQERTTAVDEGGAFALDVEGLQPPFLLKAESIHGEETTRIYSVSIAGGRANINPMTDAAVAGADDGDQGEVAGSADTFERSDHERIRRTASRFERLITELQSALKPLFDLYAVPADPFTDDGRAEELRAMLRDVRIQVWEGSVVVTNRATGGVIFTGPLNDLPSGTFHPANLPASAGTPPPATCTYAYSAWADCQVDGTRSRTVAESSPAGCTGTPVVSEACTYVPPVTTCSSFTYSPWGACGSSNTQTRTVTSSSPAGCTGGSPVLTQACTYVPPVTTCSAFTYSPWGACGSNNTQTRTVASSSPAGCTGGSPVLTQACTYVPPTTSCTGCHSIPPATGKHARHTSFASCGTCHGSGYSATTVNSATHADGTKNLATTIGWNATSRSCANSCHGSKSW
jgi:hypothetical protein